MNFSFPRTAGLSAFQLKFFALLAMTLDHIAAYLPLPIPGWFHLIGRLAAPIFLFLCAEGFAHTRSRRSYLKRLYLAFVLMSIGNLTVNHFFSTPGGVIVTNGMFQTMFLVVWVLLCLESLRTGMREKQGKRIAAALGGLLLTVLTAVPLILLMTQTMDASGLVVPWARICVQIYSAFVPNLLLTEGSFLWVALGVMLYYLRGHRIVLAVLFTLFWIVIGTLPDGFFAWLSLIPILLYNGAPGKHKMKAFFYAYYPVHVYILFIARWVLITQFGF